jgi:hypothetical protein
MLKFIVLPKKMANNKRINHVKGLNLKPTKKYSKK